MPSTIGFGSRYVQMRPSPADGDKCTGLSAWIGHVAERLAHQGHGRQDIRAVHRHGADRTALLAPAQVQAADDRLGADPLDQAAQRQILYES
jgi:hypothetical protein